MRMNVCVHDLENMYVWMIFYAHYLALLINNVCMYVCMAAGLALSVHMSM